MALMYNDRLSPVSHLDIVHRFIDRQLFNPTALTQNVKIKSFNLFSFLKFDDHALSETLSSQLAPLVAIFDMMPGCIATCIQLL